MAGMDKWTLMGYHRRRGASAVELAIVVPVLLTMVLGGFDLGRYTYTYIALSDACRAGASWAMLNPPSEHVVSRYVLAESGSSGRVERDVTTAGLSGGQPDGRHGDPMLDSTQRRLLFHRPGQLSVHDPRQLEPTAVTASPTRLPLRSRSRWHLSDPENSEPTPAPIATIILERAAMIVRPGNARFAAAPPWPRRRSSSQSCWQSSLARSTSGCASSITMGSPRPHARGSRIASVHGALASTDGSGTSWGPTADLRGRQFHGRHRPPPSAVPVRSPASIPRT